MKKIISAFLAASLLAMSFLVAGLSVASASSDDYYAYLSKTSYGGSDTYLEGVVEFPEGVGSLVITWLYSDCGDLLTDPYDPIGFELYHSDQTPMPFYIPIISATDCYNDPVYSCIGSDGAYPYNGSYYMVVEVYEWSESLQNYEYDPIYTSGNLSFDYNGDGSSSLSCGGDEPTCGDAVCSVGETCAADNCCSGATTDLENDESNCGWCANVCDSDEKCEMGLCKSSYSPPSFDEAVEDMECSTEDCEEAQQCIIEISPVESCAAEVADIIPIIDKPVAVALLASDLCELKHRLVDNLDILGAAVTAVLTVVDFVDNIPDTISVAGYAISVPVDALEGPADCLEGIVYSYLDSCGGYTWCVVNLMKEVATQSIELGRSGVNYAWSLVFSPATIGVVDDYGNELGVKDGVFVFEFGDFKAVMVKEPDKISGGYNLALEGTGSGTYDLQTIVFDEDGEQVADVLKEDIPVSAGQKDYYAVSVPSDPSSDNVSMEETDIESAVSLSFSDMSSGGHWSYDYVTTLVSRGVISGYADGTFRPNNDITRAEVLKIAMEAAGFSKSDSGWDHYSDVGESDWFAGYVGSAVNHGVIGAEGGSHFRPNEKATRIESLEIILTAVSLGLFEAGGTIDPYGGEIPVVADPPNFSDTDIYDGYANNYNSLIEDSVVFGFIHPNPYGDNTFRPNNPITRAEVSKITVTIQDFFDEYAEW